MTERNITVQVGGPPAAGKSVVGLLIAQILRIAGLKTELVDDNGLGFVDEEPGTIASSIQDRLDSIRKQGTEVKVRTIVTRRRPVQAGSYYVLEDEDFDRLRAIQARLHGGSDKMRDEGHKLWLILNKVEDIGKIKINSEGK